jgi:acetolactate synthase-1/3 small subunit
MTGVESKIEGLIQVLKEGDNPILEVCRSGKMTMRRGHHTSSVLKAMGAAAQTVEPEPPESENQVLQAAEGAVVEPE